MLVHILGALVLFLVALYCFLTTKYDYWRKRGVAGPEPSFLVGTYPKTYRGLPGYSLLAEADEIFQKYYKKHRYIGTFEVTRPTLMILDPTLAKDVLVKYFKHFENNSFSYTVHKENDPLYGRNPFYMRGDDWKSNRSNVSAAFTHNKLRPMFSVVAEVCHRMIDFIERNPHQAFQTKDFASRFTADVVYDCIFGFDSRAFEDEDLLLKRADELFQVPWKVQKLGKLLDIFPCLYKLLAVPTSPPAANRWFVDLMRNAIEVRRKCQIQRDDYLNFLMELQTRYNLSVEDVAGYGFTFFFDGYETSNAFLGAGLSFLAKNSNCQERLRNEISTHENIDYDRLNQMPYLDCVFNEILRLAPFPFRVRKKCTKSVALTDYDGSVLKVEEGIDVLLPMFSLQNHDAFYAEPDVFNPDRFYENSRGAKQFKDSGAFMPFGNGPRVCVGMRFASTQIKAAIIGILKHFEIVPATVASHTGKETKSRFLVDYKSVVSFKKIS